MDGTEIVLLGAEDAAVLADVAPGLFDHPVTPEGAAAFLRAPGHLIAVARAGGTVVAFASGTILRHPDKAPQLFVNEVATAEPWRRWGLARACVLRLTRAAARQGARGGWVATEGDNAPARALYRSLGLAEATGVAVYDWQDADRA
jgi:ribosomal protein S18 acetylase RimI-like enzyme